MLPHHARRSALTTLTLSTALVASATLLPVTAAHAAVRTGTPAAATRASAPPRHVDYAQWDTAAELRRGVFRGTTVRAGRLRLTDTPFTAHVGGRTYGFGSWFSPRVRPGFDLTEVVPSWAATTPEGTLVQVDVRGVSLSGARSSWDTLGRWAHGDRRFARTSLGSQRDDLAHVATDTWLSTYGGFRSWQLRVRLLREAGSTRTPTVGTIGAMSSELPAVDDVATSRPGVARGVVLPVPRYSQMVHAGEYPRYGGGGEAWCSPTATTMVLAYYDALPSARATSWVKGTYRDPEVDHAARMTFDHGYDGTGNWPFNTAYAARRAGHAFVTRFRSLRGVEQMVRAGIPVVTSISFARGGLDGAPISSTNGHLVVVVGFTASGDVVVNDPAARTRAGVRRTYDRGQFEDAWLQRYPSGSGMHGSGGLGYVIRDDAHPLPARTGNTNW